MTLEICVDSVDSAIAAEQGGADRIELCSALSEGGITPSAGLIRRVRASVSIPIHTIIRPSGGAFACSNSEFEVMREDILTAKSLGTNGVVLGILTPDHRIDQTRTRALIELAHPLSVTFHRAFDMAPDLETALEEVIACGAHRILTSGGEETALAGAERLAKLCDRAGDRITILAGGGVRLNNIRRIFLISGVSEMHTSLNSSTAEGASPTADALRLGWDASARTVLRKEQVEAIQMELTSLLG